MAKRYPFVKRYGLEGNESMLVAMDTTFRAASEGAVPSPEPPCATCPRHTGGL